MAPRDVMSGYLGNIAVARSVLTMLVRLIKIGKMPATTLRGSGVLYGRRRADVSRSRYVVYVIFETVGIGISCTILKSP
jgi:hypothetical protein